MSFHDRRRLQPRARTSYPNEGFRTAAAAAQSARPLPAPLPQRGSTGSPWVPGHLVHSETVPSNQVPSQRMSASSSTGGGVAILAPPIVAHGDPLEHRSLGSRNEYAHLRDSFSSTDPRSRPPARTRAPPTSNSFISDARASTSSSATSSSFSVDSSTQSPRRIAGQGPSGSPSCPSSSSFSSSRTGTMTPVWNELSGGDSVGPGGGFSGSESGWTRINAASSGMGGPSDNGIEDGSNGNGSGAGRGGGGEGGPDGDGGDDDRATKDKAKKANPLVDLIETETAYVSELGKIIKKVAGAWSRSNFPPPELDTMFRNVESIYRVNRSFLRSLKEIGPNPSSPRALGDLLMRWIDDLETPYTRYCENYFTDFDTWATVQSNAKLPPLLQQISESEDGLPIVYSDKKRQAGSVWTLDQLFALPQTRLKYYKKLYARLLKSTQPGRSDHRLLVAANEKLDELLELSKRRIATSILDDGSILRSSTRASAESSAGDTSNTLDSAPAQRASSATSAASGEAHHTPQPTIKDGSPPFQATVQAPTPLVKVPEPSPNGRLPSSHDSALEPTDNLEYRLDTARTLDIFSMQPKKCQLRMNPPTLPFTRELRKSADVVIYFTPTSTGNELVLRRAHIFLLTDLFLICERKTPSERAGGTTKADLWLLYPPLAGKHLRVTDAGGGQGNVLSVLVLKKETLIIHTESRQAKEDWIYQFAECQKFANNLGLKLKTGSDAPQDQSNPLSPGPQATPSLSPAISVTPSSRESDSIRDGSIINGLPPVMSPHSSMSSSLARDNSFNSFVNKPDGHQSNGNGHINSYPNGSSPDPRMRTMAASPSPMSPTMMSSPMTGSGPGYGPGSYGRPSPPLGPGRPGQFRPGFVTPRPSGIGSTNKASLPPPLRPGLNDSPPSRPMSPPGQPPSSNKGNAGRPWPPLPPPNAMHAHSGRPPQRPPPSQSDFLHEGPRGANRRPSAPNLRGASESGHNGIHDRGNNGGPYRSRSASSEHSGPPKLPSDFLKQPGARPKDQEYSPPSSPTQTRRGPKSSQVAAQMRCRLYLKQSHAQWKSLGNARLKLYHLMPDDVKQLVVENDKKPDPLISSIILPDGVERVGKVGVAIELSDNGQRTGIIYMIHLRSEESAVALFGQLLEGSDRSVIGTLS